MLHGIYTGIISFCAGALAMGIYNRGKKVDKIFAYVYFLLWILVLLYTCR